MKKSRSTPLIKTVVLFLIFSWVIFLNMDAALAQTEPYQEDMIEEYLRARARTVQEFEENELIRQVITVEFTRGPEKGKTVELENFYYSYEHPMTIEVEEGMELIIVAVEEGEETNYYVQDRARDRGVLYLLLLGVALLIAVGRLKGVKTIIALAFTGLLLFYYLLPRLLEGQNPVLLSVLVAGLVIIFSLVLISGFNLKSLAAIIGTLTGVIVAGVLTLWVGEVAHLTGFNTDEAQMLSYMNYDLDVRGILFAGIIIGSLGAITDVGISVASAAAEIKEASPSLGIASLVRGGLNVGRDVMGTMVNTLILAYVGTATPLLLLFMGYEMAWLRVINMDLIATELVRGLVGVIGLVVAIPVTALTAGFLLGTKTPRGSKKKRPGTRTTKKKRKR